MPDIILCGGLIYNSTHDAVLLLYRPKQGWWETPGGKLERSECVDFAKPTIAELANAALRELHEELGEDLVFTPLRHAAQVPFILPDGRSVLAHKFDTRIEQGTPRITEPQTFSELKYIALRDLRNLPCSPDLSILRASLT